MSLWNCTDTLVRFASLIQIVLLAGCPSISWTRALLELPSFAMTLEVPKPEDKTAATLAKARIRYEEAMEAMRADVGKALDKKATVASKSREGAGEKVKEVGKAVAAFQSEGEWPDLPQLDNFRNAAARAAIAMQKAYKDAAAEYARANRKELQKAVSAEAELFAGYSDLAAWRLVPLGAESGSTRSLTPDEDLISVEVDPDDGYRVEILARSESASGHLRIELPLGDEECVRVSAKPDAEGRIRMLMTVADGTVSADLGIGRPLDLDQTHSKDDDDIEVWAVGGTVIVESMRVKPLVEGGPEELHKVDRSDRSDDGEKMESLVGTKWEGEFRNSKGAHAATAIVTTHARDGIILRVVTHYSTADWKFRLRGGNLALAETRRVTKGDVTIVNPKVSGGLTDESLDVSGSWTYRGPRASGGESVSLNLRKK